ncbi:MAG TPA: nicotinate (nicotinamide) nucleotide adenylyltransferase [Micavibrio sp.]
MALFTPPHLLNGQRWRGMRIGLLGGSFNPPHEGHLHISKIALRRLSLDCVWWMVTPQNPLKNKNETLHYEDRLGLCNRMTCGHPRIIVSDIERQMGVIRTVETLHHLKKAFPATYFTLLAGSDIVFQLHRWHRWKELTNLAPLVFIGRPPAADLVRNAPARELFKRNRSWILSEPLHPASSSKIRNHLKTNS